MYNNADYDFLVLLLSLTLSKLPGGPMQLVASSPEPKYVTAPPGGAPTSSLLPGPHSQTPEQKFAPFPLTVSTTGGHEGHQQKGEIVSHKTTFEANYGVYTVPNAYSKLQE